MHLSAADARSSMTATRRKHWTLHLPAADARNPMAAFRRKH